MEDIPEEQKNQLEKLIVKEPFELGTQFHRNGTEVSNSLGKKQKVTLLLFSGSYCPPCRSLLPKLLDFYKDANIIEQLIEIIYVSYDKTDDEYQLSVKQMPWLALPFNDSRIKKYSTNFNIKGIPMLIAIRPNLSVITMNAKLDVIKCIKDQTDPEIEVNRWLEQINE